MLVKRIVLLLLSCTIFPLQCANSSIDISPKSIQSIREHTLTEYSKKQNPVEQVTVIKKGESELYLIEDQIESAEEAHKPTIRQELKLARKNMKLRRVMAEKAIINNDNNMVDKIALYLEDGHVEAALKYAERIFDQNIKKEQLEIIKQQQQERIAIAQGTSTPRMFSRQKIQRGNSKNIRELTNSVSHNEKAFSPYIRKMSARRQPEFDPPKTSPRQSPDQTDDQINDRQESPQQTIQMNKNFIIIAGILASLATARAGYRYYRNQQKSTFAQLTALSNSFDETNTEQQHHAQKLLHRLVQELHTRIPHLPEQQRQQLWALVEYIETIEYNHITKDILENIVSSTKQFL